MYAKRRRGATECDRGCALLYVGHPGGAAVRLMDAEDYLPEIWLRPALRGQHLKGPMEPDLHGTWLACRQDDREVDRHFWQLWEEFYFPAEFREKRRVALSGLEK